MFQNLQRIRGYGWWGYSYFLNFVNEGGRRLDTQTDAGAYTNVDYSLQTSPKGTITEIVVDVLEAKNGPGVESDSDPEEPPPDKPTATKKKAL